MAAAERPSDRVRGRNGGAARRDDAVVLPPRRPGAVRGHIDVRSDRRPVRTELEARRRPVTTSRASVDEEWSRSTTEVPVAERPGHLASPTDDLADHGLDPSSNGGVDVIDARPIGIPDLSTSAGVFAVALHDATTPVAFTGPTTAPVPLSPPIGYDTGAMLALPTAPVDDVAPETAPPPARVAPAHRRSVFRRRGRIRRVSRVVRRVDSWSVFKISIILYALVYAILLVAGVLLWKLANETGTVANLEGFVKELFGLQTFKLNGKELYRASWRIGALLVIAGTGMNVTAAVMFNLITDLVGGVRVTVLEEEVRVVERTTRRMRRDAKDAAKQAG